MTQTTVPQLAGSAQGSHPQLPQAAPSAQPGTWAAYQQALPLAFNRLGA